MTNKNQKNKEKKESEVINKTKCRTCHKPLEVIKFIEVVTNKGVLFYNQEFDDVEHKHKEQECKSIMYRCSNCNALLTANEKEALKMLDRS